MKVEKIVIGSSLSSSEEGTDTFQKQASFQGQISNFLMYPFEITPEEVHQTSQSSNRGRKATAKASFVASLFKSDKDKKSDFDPNHLIENSILNLNSFVKMTRLNVHQEINWNDNCYMYQTNQKKALAIFSSILLLNLCLICLKIRSQLYRCKSFKLKVVVYSIWKR